MSLLALFDWENVLTFDMADPYRFAILNYSMLDFKLLTTIDRKTVKNF